MLTDFMVRMINWTLLVMASLAGVGLYTIIKWVFF
jgi:hypothetical protein